MFGLVLGYRGRGIVGGSDGLRFGEFVVDVGDGGIDLYVFVFLLRFGFPLL